MRPLPLCGFGSGNGAIGLIDHCYLLNEKNEWEPARNPLNRHSSISQDAALQRLGPGYAFARKMVEQDKNVSIGLVVNARRDTKIDDWLGKSEFYWAARKRAKAAMRQGTLKGVLWHQGESDKAAADGYRTNSKPSSATCAPKPPSDIKLIDPHVHAMSVTPLGLRAVAKWMEERNVERCIVSPLNHKGSRAWTEEERKQLLENFLPYKGKIDRMTIIDPGEVETVAQAVTLLKREIADGAVGFGEHYGVGLMFDDPKNLMLYEACEKVGLPVMFHIDQNKNMVEPGMERVDRVLKMFPKCKVVAHAYWWRQSQNGACDRQLQEHPNLYADMSGTVVVQVLNRDRKYAREFLIRNQDKILWATDEGWWSFGSQTKQMNQHYTFLEELDLPAEVRHKIYRGNAEKVYGLKKEGK